MAGRRPDPLGAGRVSVLIVSYRTPALTEQAVRSALVDGAVADVVVVDNDSGDETLDRLRRLADPRVVLVDNPTNAGFGTAANLAARHATADTLVFLNSDARVRPGAIGALADVLGDADGQAIVGPRLVATDGAVQRSAGLVPRPGDLLVRGLGLHRLARALARIPGLGALVARSSMATEYDLAVTATAPIDVSMVSGACFAIGRTAFESLDGFDERYFMYFEDADLCRRATRAGWPIRYLPDAVVDHVGGASSADDYHFGPRHAASMVRYLRTWHGVPGLTAAIAILWLRLLGQALTLRPTTGRAASSLRAGLAVALGR
jgi:N-acetylglucosaminyl-diphospho-decaprenol L-rhamnosyltransferase